MKISNFLFNYLSIPLLPDNNKTIKFLSLILRFSLTHRFFYKYLEICLRKRENQKIIFSVERFVFRRNLSLYIIDIYLTSLRNLGIHEKCKIISLEIINLYPKSDIGYWHLIHSYIGLGLVNNALEITKKFRNASIKSSRINSLCIGNKEIEELIKLSKIDRYSSFYNLFFNDAGIVGQTLLNIGQELNNEKEFALFIKSHGGFSNTIQAVLNAIGIAKLLRIREIYIIKTNLTHSLNLDKLLFENIKIKAIKTSPKVNYISGNFFSHYLFLNNQNKKFNKERLGYARSLLLNYCLPRNEKNDEIIIHIRSSDIFRKRTAHRKYGQPPLAYYLICISHLRPSKLTLIFENYSNPVINLLINYLNSIKCEINLYPKNTLRDDVSALIHAKTIICGKGTFVPGILLGSNSIKNLYLFEPEKDYQKFWSLERVENLYKVKDVNGYYKKQVLNNNWKASSAQINLMKTYSINNLKLMSIQSK